MRGPIWWGEAPEALNDSTKGKLQKRQPWISKAFRRAEPWPATHQRLGAFNGLIAQLSGDRRTLRYTDLAIRSLAPPNRAPAPPSSLTTYCLTVYCLLFALPFTE